MCTCRMSEPPRERITGEASKSWIDVLRLPHKQCINIKEPILVAVYDHLYFRFKPNKGAIMGTYPLGKERKTIGINMKQEMADEIERRAHSMQLSMGAYCKIILGQWIESGEKLKLQER